MKCPHCPFESEDKAVYWGHIGGAHIRKVPPLVAIRHGFAAGARSHRRRGEKPCALCADAWRLYIREYRMVRKGTIRNEDRKAINDR